MTVLNKKNLDICRLSPGDVEHNSGLHITEKFTEITNGHYVVRVSIVKQDSVELPKSKLHKPLKRKRIDCIIEKKTAEKVMKMISGRGGEYRSWENFAWIGQNTDAKNTEFITSDLETFNTIVEKRNGKKFPDVNKLMKSQGLTRKGKTRIAFNPEYMKKICEQFGKTGVRSIKLTFYNENKAIKLEGLGGDQEITALLMPMKLDRDSSYRVAKEEKKKVENQEESEEDNT